MNFLPARSRSMLRANAAILALASLQMSCGDEADEAAPDGQYDGPPISLAPYAEVGSYVTTREAASSADCTIFRPADLSVGGALPVIIWGNGTFSTPDTYSAGLSHLASHGFIVAAANTGNAGKGTEMAACLDWLVAENERAGSAYAGRVDTAHVGASGHSQGGGGTLMFGRDARVTATAPLEPYVTENLVMFGHDPASQSSQHGPMLLLSGEQDAIATPAENQVPVFAASNVPTVWGTQRAADHVGSAIGNFGNFRAPITAWFRYQLAGDAPARSIFYPGDCTLCTDPLWVVKQKNL